MPVEQLISTLGFPIACVIGMAWYIVTVQKQLLETIAKNTEAINDLRIALSEKSKKEE